jgi:hypothetical protein
MKNLRVVCYQYRLINIRFYGLTVSETGVLSFRWLDSKINKIYVKILGFFYSSV